MPTRRLDWPMLGFTCALVVCAGQVARTEESAPPQGKWKVPSADEQAAATKQVRAIFAADYAKNTTEERLALAKKLVAKAGEVRADPAARYAMFDEARLLAATWGDLALAFSVIEALNGAYELDAAELRRTTLLLAARTASPGEQAKSVARLGLPVLDELANGERYAQAQELNLVLRRLAERAGDAATVADLQAKYQATENLRAEQSSVAPALARLAAAPDDPEGNLIAGRYYALVRGDWAKALPFLAKAKDEGFKRAALGELAAPKEPGEMAADLGDLWWEVAQKEFRGPRKDRLVLHAREWYERALPKLPDLRRIAIEERLAQMDKSGQAPAPPGGRTLSLDLGKGIKLELVLIPAGTFTMGSPETEKDRGKNEGPQHQVRISKPFYMGKYEVTQGQYEAVMGKNHSANKGAKNPVENVSWDEAQEFCKKLSAKVRTTVRLPTEAEWEYACRAGTKTRFYSGDADDDLDAVAWHKGNADGKTHPVGQKKPNAWGLYDIHGNVWEFCQDWYADEYEAGAAVDPTGARNGTARVLRGGSWWQFPGHCNSAARNWCTPDNNRISHYGFRVLAPGQK